MSDDLLPPEHRCLLEADPTLTAAEIAWCIAHSYPGMCSHSDHRSDRLRAALKTLRHRQDAGLGLAPMIPPNPAAIAMVRLAQMDATADAAVLAAYHARVTAAFGVTTAAAIMQAARTDAERGR